MQIYNPFDVFFVSYLFFLFNLIEYKFLLFLVYTKLYAWLCNAKIPFQFIIRKFMRRTNILPGKDTITTSVKVGTPYKIEILTSLAEFACNPNKNIHTKAVVCNGVCYMCSIFISGHHEFGWNCVFAFFVRCTFCANNKSKPYSYEPCRTFLYVKLPNCMKGLGF